MITTFDKLNRRTHMFLGLFLMPWLLMYGVSSFIVIHQSWFRQKQEVSWVPVFEKDYRRAINAQKDLRLTAQEILKDCSMEGAFWAERPNANTLVVNRFSFWDATRLTYSLKDQKLKAERQQMRPSQAVVRMHFRGGFRQPTFADNLWGFLVDLACVGIVIWILSGLIMWWRLPGFKAWGALAVGSGALLFLLLMWLL